MGARGHGTWDTGTWDQENRSSCLAGPLTITLILCSSEEKVNCLSCASSTPPEYPPGGRATVGTKVSNDPGGGSSRVWGQRKEREVRLGEGESHIWQH